MSEPIPVPDLEADAIRHRRAIWLQADAILNDGIKQVLQRMGLPEDWVIEIRKDDSMVAVAPSSTGSPTGAAE